MDGLKPADIEGAIEVARAYLQDQGDIPEATYQALGMMQRDPADMYRQLDELRQRHFEQRGQEAPGYGVME